MALKAKQRRAIALLISGSSITNVAADLDVARSTVHRWLNTPKFYDALDAEFRFMVDELTLRWLNVAGAAPGQIETILRDKEATDATKIAALRLTNDAFLRLTELRNIERRLVRLQEMLGEISGRQTA